MKTVRQKGWRVVSNGSIKDQRQKALLKVKHTSENWLKVTKKAGKINEASWVSNESRRVRRKVCVRKRWDEIDGKWGVIWLQSRDAISLRHLCVLANDQQYKLQASNCTEGDSWTERGISTEPNCDPVTSLNYEQWRLNLITQVCWCMQIIDH